MVSEPGLRGCYLAVEKLRSWYTGQRQHPAPAGSTEDPALARRDIEAGRRRYLAGLAAAGHSHAELRVVEAALDHLCAYLDNPHAEPACPDRPAPINTR